MLLCYCIVVLKTLLYVLDNVEFMQTLNQVSSNMMYSLREATKHKLRIDQLLAPFQVQLVQFMKYLELSSLEAFLGRCFYKN